MKIHVSFLYLKVQPCKVKKVCILNAWNEALNMIFANSLVEFIYNITYPSRDVSFHWEVIRVVTPTRH